MRPALRPIARAGCRWGLTLLALGVVVAWVGTGGEHGGRGVVVGLRAAGLGGGAVTIAWSSPGAIDEQVREVAGSDNFPTGPYVDGMLREYRKLLERQARGSLRRVTESGLRSGEFDRRRYPVPWAWTSKLGHSPSSALAIALWLPLAAFALPALVLWWPHVRAIGRAKPGHCPRCGYDRAGLAAGAKCPECGTVAAPASK